MTEEPPAPKSLRILVIVSRPLDLPDLPNLADQWALQSGLYRVKAPAYLKMLRPPTVDSLRTEILNGYDIVHFDGHGDFGGRCPNCGALNEPQQMQCGRCEALLEDEAASGYLAFEREDGLLNALAAEELAEIVISLPESEPKLVFLSACESAKGDKASLLNVLLKNEVPAVLGMKESISLEATMALTTPFYAGLGAGMTIDQAFENALPVLNGLENGRKLEQIMVLEGPGKEARILTAKATGRASFEAERLFGLPEQEFVGDYIRADPPQGRKGLLSQAMDALRSREKLVVFTGQGGIGKTVLAVETARRLAWRYPGGVFWRSAADMERLGLEEMLNAFDNIFGPQLRTLPLDQKRDMILNYLRNYDTASLLIVDNAEIIKDESLWRFLEGIPQPSAALVTTRRSLPREGKEIRIPEMEEGEAARLLWQEARRRSPRWGEHFSPEDKDSLKEIAGFMKGHPLAIKLTAALLSRRSISCIREELRKNPPKEVSQRFDVSFNSLTDRQRDLFCRLAVFSSSMTEEAVGSICIDEEDSEWQSNLGELEERSFLDRIEIEVQDGSGNEVTLYRYKLHPLMRLYAAGIAGEELLTLLRPKAALYFLNYARTYKNNFGMLEREKENILAGMSWVAILQKSCLDESKKNAASLVLEFMSVLDGYLDTRGYWNEYLLRLQQAIEAAEILEDHKQKTGCMNNLGIILHRMGNYDEACKLHQQNIEIQKELGYKDGISRSLHQMGILAQARCDYDKARQFYLESLKIKQELGDKSGMSASLHELGRLAQAKGDYDEARQFFQHSQEILQVLGDKRNLSISLLHLGMLAQAIGEYENARQFYQQALKMAQELGDKIGLSKSLHQLAIIAHATGQRDSASNLYKQSMKIAQELGVKSDVQSSLHNLGILAQDAGDYAKARDFYEQSMEIARELGHKSSIASTLHQLGMLAQDEGDFDEARKIYLQSLKIKQELSDKNGVALSQAQMGLLEEQMGNLREALLLTCQAEVAFSELRSPFEKQTKRTRQRLEQKNSNSSSVSRAAFDYLKRKWLCWKSK